MAIQDPNDLIELVRKSKARRAAHRARALRRIEMGYETATILPNGAFSKRSPKGFVPYSTRHLADEVREIMDRSEKAGGRRVCHINGKHQLQIRGKHLHRLLKKMPNVRQVGRSLVEEPPQNEN
jgi:hypothetical protein